MSGHSYTCISDAGVVVCDDCGAYATTDNEVVHYANCQPGESEKWQAIYNEEDADEGIQEAT